MTEGPFGPLLTWYRREQRDLPWRQGRDPYAILVSEIMLQQTRVETVIPYYHRFLQRFPSALELASASLDEVYEMWAGLGYYRRARNLQRAAQVVRDRGGFPCEEAELRALPGVGEYTAAALASIAWNRPALALDGNALRVLCRFLGVSTPAQAVATRRELKRRVLPEIRESEAGDFTQAVMELGARLCLPRKPRCGECPLSSACVAHRDGLTAQIPVLPPPRPRQKVELLALRIWNQDRVLLERREDDPFLAQQWVTPWFFGPAADRLEEYRERFPGTEPQFVGRVQHGVTFRDLEVDIWEWHTDRENCEGEQRWAAWSAGQTRLPRLASKVLMATEPYRTCPQC